MHKKEPGRKGGWLLTTKLRGPMESFDLSENADIRVYIFEFGLNKLRMYCSTYYLMSTHVLMYNTL